MDLDYHVNRLAVQPSLSVLTTKVCRGWHMNYQPSACEANVSMDYAIAAEVMLLKKDIHD